MAVVDVSPDHPRLGGKLAPVERPDGQFAVKDDTLQQRRGSCVPRFLRWFHVVIGSSGGLLRDGASYTVRLSAARQFGLWLTSAGPVQQHVLLHDERPERANEFL